MKKIVLVTGGNRGIGLAIVQEMAKLVDHQVLLGCRDLTEGEKLASRLGDHVTSVSLEKVDESLRINTTAPLELIRAVMPLMKKHDYGRIVNITSGWGSFDDGRSFTGTRCRNCRLVSTNR